MKKTFHEWFRVSWRDTGVSLAILLGAVALCAVLLRLDPSGGYASMVFVLAVVCIARYTAGYLYGIFASFVGVVCTNYIFTYPYWSLDFTVAGYPLTFLAMLAVSIVVSALTTQIKDHERLRSETEKEKLRANLLRAISHDIRTPLTSIVGSVSAILENGDKLPRADCRELLTHVQEEGQWLINMVENLLSITRMEDGGALLSRQPEVLEEVAGSAVHKFRRRHPAVEVSIQAPEEIALVSMDVTLMEQVLMNVMENAVIHGQSTTAIRISFRQERETVTVVIADNGGGVAQHLLPHILQDTYAQFQDRRSDTRRNMGIGLSVCRTIIAAHGGVIAVKNTEQGAEFAITLPLTGEEETDV